MSDIAPGEKGSTATKAALGGLGGAAIVGSIAVLKPDLDRNILLILLAALVLIPVVLLGYKLVLKWLASRKANPFTEGVTGAAGSTPNSISAAASRAKLDSLRRNFEEGVKKFAAAGKNLYQLPWYVAIGESGSGKTEAIRHSSIPFPPGLQDYLQGAGGTVNMNWWFTNDAVILDTAGRYLFDEMQPGASGEWTEFLSLLSQSRPQCPINGLLLVIPANSLILDTADAIERKAGKIAQQLDRIQRTLDLRFPVFVIVTKCDLINGFREFFDGFTVQEQQAQMVGWSNPAPLDEPFNAELVDEHLKTVHARLTQRRSGLLLDPVAQEAADAKRIDEVDSLYSLPDSFLRIAPRLRQYLDMVFVAGEWSAKPLFLRGIYFTSAMREGQALDAELAELLGVPVDSLSETRMWDKERAFFLRDLFLKKVFPEKGLVTRAVSASKVERNRKVALLAGGFVSALALLGFTVFGSWQLNNSVIGQAKEWGALKDAKLEIVKQKTPSPLAYESQLDAIPDGMTRTVFESHKKLEELAQREIQVPLVLRPAAGIINRSVNSADLNASRLAFYRGLYAKNVIFPLSDAVSKKFEEKTAAGWPAEATPALGELIHLRARQRPDISPMFAYAVSKPALDANKEYFTTLTKGLTAVQPGDGIWPDPVKDELLKGGVNAGVDKFIAYWKGQIDDLNAKYAKLTNARGEPAALEAAQRELASTCDKFAVDPPKTLDQYMQDVQKWKDAWARYDAAYQAMDKTVKELGDGPVPLVERYKAAHKLQAGEAAKAYQVLLDTFPASSAAADPATPDGASADSLADVRRRVEKARDGLGATISYDIIASLEDYNKKLLAVIGATTDTPGQYQFAVVRQMYEPANALLASPADPSAAPAAISPKELEEKIAGARKDVDDKSKALPGKTDADKASRDAVTRTCDGLFDMLVLPKAHYDELKSRLGENTKTFEELAAARAEKRGDRPRTLDVPFTDVARTPIPLYFSPAAAHDVLIAQQSLVKEIDETCARVVKARQGSYEVPFTLDGDLLKARMATRQREVARYVESYTSFYASLLRAAGQPALTVPWNVLQTETLPKNPTSIILAGLKDVGQAVVEALEELPGNLGEIPPAADVRDAARRGIMDASNPKYFDGMSKWRGLGPVVAPAQATLLGTSAGDLFQRWLFVVENPEKAGHVALYFDQLTRQMLHGIAITANPAAGAALAKAQSPEYQKFPLKLMAAEFLLPAQIDAIRADVDGVVLPPPAPAAGDARNRSSPDHLIGDGGRLNEGRGQDTVNPELERLVGGGMSAADWDTLKKLKTLLAGLPRAAEPPFICAISITPDVKGGVPEGRQKELMNDNRYMGRQFRVIRLFANRAPVGDKIFLNDLAPNSAFGSVSYPMDFSKGKGAFQLPYLEFHIWEFSDDYNRNLRPASITVPLNPKPELKTEWPSSNDPWQCLRYLAGNAKQLKEDKKSWDVQLKALKDKDGTAYFLWVRFTFSKELPDQDNWPK